MPRNPLVYACQTRSRGQQPASSRSGRRLPAKNHSAGCFKSLIREKAKLVTSAKALKYIRIYIPRLYLDRCTSALQPDIIAK